MKVETIVSGMLENNTYVLIEGNDAIIIDAAASVDLIKKCLGKAKPKALILTHGHYDHITNLDNILLAFDIKCYLSEKALDKLRDVYLNQSAKFHLDIKSGLDRSHFSIIGEGDVLPFLKENIFVMETPGHTDCCISLKIGSKLFTGDTLFQGTIGRTDLPTSSGVEMRQSLRKLFKIRENCTVYPGHGEITTLDAERMG